MAALSHAIDFLSTQKPTGRDGLPWWAPPSTYEDAAALIEEVAWFADDTRAAAIAEPLRHAAGRLRAGKWNEIDSALLQALAQTAALARESEPGASANPNGRDEPGDFDEALAALNGVHGSLSAAPVQDAA